MNSDEFYRAFEDRHRGSRNLIKSRLQVYLPFIQPFLNQKRNSIPKALDLGCGRGEWLETLTENGFDALGVDINEGMLEACRKLDLHVSNIDALEHLQAQRDSSIAVISGFHFAEHVSFENLQKIVKQTLRVLKAGGILILETPNPENIVVGTSSFYLDPTHLRPLPHLLLSFVAEHAGFERVKILRLQEPQGLLESDSISLVKVLSEVSPDYSLVAQKSAAKVTTRKFDVAFSKEYGASLDKVANLYDRQMKSKIDTFAELTTIREEKAAADTGKEHLYAELATIREEKAAADAVKEQLYAELATIREEKAITDAVKEQLSQNIKITTNQIENLKTENTELNRKLQDKESSNDQLRNECKEAKEQIEKLLQTNQHWCSVTEQQNTELDLAKVNLQALYASKSWRITWPLRKFLQFFKWSFSLPPQFALWLVGLQKRLTRWFLIKIRTFVRAHPKLQVQTQTWLDKHPQIRGKLFLLTQSKPTLVPLHAASITPTEEQASNFETAEFSSLTPSENRVYRNLKSAIENNFKESI